MSLELERGGENGNGNERNKWGGLCLLGGGGEKLSKKDTRAECTTAPIPEQRVKSG